MQKIVGGVGVDGGGFVITPNGIVPVPPWDPNVRIRLDAVAALAQLRALDAEADVQPVVTRLMGEVTERLGVGAQATYVYASSAGHLVSSDTHGNAMSPPPAEVEIWRKLQELLEKKRWPPPPDPEPPFRALVRNVVVPAVATALSVRFAQVVSGRRIA